MVKVVKSDKEVKTVVRVSVDKEVWREYRSHLVSKGLTVSQALEVLINKEVNRVRRARG
jgi:antitoxin component of RelBE/YafQ-DinJ toxin-antitoxin module